MGVTGHMTPDVAIKNDTVLLTVSWDAGTDINIAVDFGDGNSLQWNWQVRRNKLPDLFF